MYEAGIQHTGVVPTNVCLTDEPGEESIDQLSIVHLDRLPV